MSQSGARQYADSTGVLLRDTERSGVGLASDARADLDRGPDDRGAGEAVRWRARRWVIMLAITALSLNNATGLIVPDTKLDLTENPWGFLGRALHLWDRQGFAGQVQDQAYGYLFPMGPFFGVGTTMGLPAWVVQRLWWAVVLCVAFMGMTLLIERFNAAGPLAATLGGLAYAGSPHLLTVLGPVSSEVWPMALAPFVLLPLVNLPEDASVRRAAVRSALAVLLMGAINATAVVAAVLPAGLWLVTRPVCRRSLRLLLWWLGSVFAVTLWWVVPLLLLGRYSPPFLDYIENAGIVTSTTTLFETLRGTADWRAYVPSSGWTAGYLLLTQAAIVFATGLVVVAGLIGLTRRRLPYQRYLVGLFLLGVTIIASGFVGSVDGFLALPIRGWLDGWASALRNVHKFDVMLRIPLIIGMASVVSRLRWGRTAAEQRVTRRFGLIAVVVVLLAAASPAVVLRLAPEGGYGSIPGYWRETAQWLAKNSATERALVIPGARFAYFEWGRPKDEPLQPLAHSPWEVRDAVPMVPPEQIRVLDTIESLFDTAQPSAGLAGYLNENGFDYLVVRNDLDYAAAGAPRPAQVHATLLGSPRITRVATFGPPVGSVGNPSFAVDQGLQQSYPAVEVFRVGDPADYPRARVVAQSGLNQVAGGPEAGLGIATIDGGPAPSVLAGDLATTAAGSRLRPGNTIVTDTLRRKDVTFGRNDNAASQTLTAPQPPQVPKKVLDYLPTWADGRQTVAQYYGIAGVEASSSASSATALTQTVPGDQPFAALDHDAATAWRTAPVSNPTGQWVQVNLNVPTSVPSIQLRFTDQGTVRRVSIDTDQSHQVVNLAHPDRLTRIDLSQSTRPISHLRVTVDAVTSDNIAVQQIGIRTLNLANVDPERFLVVPESTGAEPVNQFAFASDGGRANACLMLGELPVCAHGLARQDEDAAGLYRQFTVPSADTYTPAATVMANPSSQLQSMLTSAIGAPMTITTSSTAFPDPIASGLSLDDGDPDTTWVASPTDRNPSVTVKFDRTRTISNLSVTMPPSYAATAPTSVTVTAGTFAQTVPLLDPSRIDITPVTTRTLTLTFHAPALRASLSAGDGFPTQLGIGVSGVHFSGVPAALRTTADRTPVQLACGQGPDLYVDGTRFRTSVSTTVKDLRELRPVALTICGDARSVTLAPGVHLLRAASTPLWQVASVNLTDATYLRPAAPSASSGATITLWTPTGARVRVAARGQPSILVINENTNPGWQARLGGHTLATIPVDGWQQGYLLPAGAAGVVELTFTPDHTYRLGLLVGAVAILIVLGLLLWPVRRRVRETVRGRRLPAATVAVLGVVTLVAVGGWWGVGAGLLVLALARRYRRQPRRAELVLQLIAGTAFLVAVFAVASGHAYSSHYRAPDGWVQVCCLLAIAAVAASALTRREAAPLPEDGGS